MWSWLRRHKGTWLSGIQWRIIASNLLWQLWVDMHDELLVLDFNFTTPPLILDSSLGSFSIIELFVKLITPDLARPSKQLVWNHQNRFEFYAYFIQFSKIRVYPPLNLSYPSNLIKLHLFSGILKRVISWARINFPYLLKSDLQRAMIKQELTPFPYLILNERREHASFTGKDNLSLWQV